MEYKCPKCGGNLVYLYTTSIGMHKYAVYKCTRCGETWKFEVGVDYLRMAGAKAAMRRVMGFRKPF